MKGSGSVDKVVTGCSNGSVILWNVATEAAQRVGQSALIQGVLTKS